ncbi:MAG: hypothetical protein OEY97_03630 [Nitrospirota bacterium]|nr:hypothetical protein [Nitrospirota bacterium]
MSASNPMNEWPFVDRRSKSRLNRYRRFFNNYWLVPVVVIYLQLLAAAMDLSGGQGIIQQNQRFISGIPVAAKLVTHDFPYTALGHAKEIYHAVQGTRGDSEQVMFHVERTKEQIYRDLVASRGLRHTEVGGVVAVGGDGARLHAIRSANAAFIESLEGLPPEALARALERPESRQMVVTLQGNTQMMDRVLGLRENRNVAEYARDAALDALLASLRTVSEARYMVEPLAFKSELGHMPEWGFAGVFHFHNELATPPSEMDVEASFAARQFVFCLTREGFDLYEIDQGRIFARQYQVDAPAAL